MSILRNLVLLTLAAATTAQSQGLDAQTIVRRSVAADAANWRLARTREYSERVESRRLDSDGNTKSREVSIYDVLLVEGTPYHRLSGRQDKRLSLMDEEKERIKLAKSQAKRQKESGGQRVKRVGEYENRPEWLRDSWRDMADAFEFSLLAGEPSAFVIEAIPRAGYQPKSRAAQVLVHLRGTLWIDRTDYHLVKADVKAVDAVWVGMFLVRLSQGARAIIEMQKVHGEVWLLRKVSLSGSVRLGLLKTLNIQHERRCGAVGCWDQLRDQAQHGEWPAARAECEFCSETLYSFGSTRSTSAVNSTFPRAFANPAESRREHNTNQ